MLTTSNPKFYPKIVESLGPYHKYREHTWRGGWSVRGAGDMLVALCFDKLAAQVIANTLNGQTYGLYCPHEYPEV